MPGLPRQLQDLAKMLTFILCHRPDEFGLVLAEDGSILVKKLLLALGGEPGWGWVRRRHLEEVAALAQPRVVEIFGEAIRGVAPGPAWLRRAGAEAPVLLYIAIPAKAHARVWEEGLRAPAGEELLLAATPEMAMKLGKRRSPDPVLVTVRARAAAEAGVRLMGYGEALHLAPVVPREFIQVPPLPKEGARPKPKAKPAEPEAALPPPGALPGDLAQAVHKAQKAGRRDEPAWKTATRRERRKKRP